MSEGANVGACVEIAVESEGAGDLPLERCNWQLIGLRPVQPHIESKEL